VGGAAQNISGSSNSANVLNTGTLVGALNFGSTSAVTVNNVQFTGVNPTTGTSISTSFGSGTIQIQSLTGGLFQTRSQTPTSVEGTYRDLLTASTVAVGTNAGFSYLISGLTPTWQYFIQFWVSDSRPGSSTEGPSTYNRSTSISGGPTLLVNTSATGTSNVGSGGVGQYVTGTFTADAATQSFSTIGSFSNNLTSGAFRNYATAMQVRFIAVPEPSTLALASLGIVSVGTWFGRRRMRLAAEESSAVDADATA
jgi:hypothetical protein